MPALDLMLGTRRLRRNIEQQAQQLQRDIESERLTRTQLQQTLVNRITSPLGLVSGVAAGFVAGEIGARSSAPKHAATHAISSATTLAIAAARSIGVQVVIPMAAEWFQSKFANRKDEAATENSSTQNGIDLPNQK